MSTESHGGVIRFTSRGPQWYVNTAHVTEGINPSIDPEINQNGDVTFDFLQSMPVVAAIAEPDETLTERGISAGISGAVSNCRIVMRKIGVGRLNLNNPTDYSYVMGDWSNLWILVVRYSGPSFTPSELAGDMP